MVPGFAKGDHLVPHVPFMVSGFAKGGPRVQYLWPEDHPVQHL